MRSEYSKWFWSECDDLNKDTSFAHNLAEKAWNYRQTEVDELQKQLIDQGQRFNEQAQYIKDLEHKSGELQKSVDAVKQLIKDYKDPSITSDKSFQHGLLLVADELEQALKGGDQNTEKQPNKHAENIATKGVKGGDQ